MLGNYSSPRNASPVSPKGSSSPKAAVNDLRRAVSEKRASKEQVETNRRSTLPNSTRSSTSSLNGSVENLNKQSPTPPTKKPSRTPSGKPFVPPPTENKPKPDLLPKRSGSNELEGKKPVLPPKPRLPVKPPKPPAKPQKVSLQEKSNSLHKTTLASLANGLSNENVNNAGIQTSAEVTSGENVNKPRVQPARPSPETRVSRHKPSGTKLLEMIEQKLDEEGIDLVQEPYSNQVIFCLAGFLNLSCYL